MKNPRRTPRINRKLSDYEELKSAVASHDAAMKRLRKNAENAKT